MRLFVAQHWLFSIKTFAAAMLALSIGFWLDLPKPYWALATVYIASQPLSGATRSKAAFRAIGTLVGSAAAVALVPNLVNAPPLLVAAISLWSGLCLYLSLLDRTPRSYVFMLAGYTTAIVGFPAVGAPDTIFDLALARTEEILVGIACAALVSNLVFPRAVGPVVAERIEAWLRHAEASSRDALDNAGPTGEARWLRLAADATEIENMAAHLAFDMMAAPRAVSHIQRLVPRMLMLLPVLSAISDRLGELAALGGVSPDIEALLARTSDWLNPEHTGDPAEGARLRRDIDARALAPLNTASWRDLMEIGLFVRLRELLELYADCRVLAAALAMDSGSLSAPLLFQIEARVERARHDDHGAALIGVFATVVAIVSCCAFWIVSAWPEGATAATMTAITGGLFAAQDDPAPSVKSFTKWTGAAILIAGLYVFLVLPNAHGVETLALALAPTYLCFGLLMTSPTTAQIGVPLALFTSTSMALQQPFSADAEGFINSGLATVLGMGFTVAATALIRPAGALWRANRFMRANELALAEAAEVHSPNDEARVMGLMFDRLALLAPIAHAIDHRMPDALRQLRAGFNILEAHQARGRMSPSARRGLDASLMRLARHYRQGSTPPTGKMLRAIHGASRIVGHEGDAQALLALAGLRRALFPDAPPLVFSARAEVVA
ncbi:MAG: FUSC family protein [Methylocystis sp.]